nr:immunoglobulin heavy chain junction region [Mus musculus]
CARHGGYFDYW